MFAGALIWIALIARVGLPYPELVVPLVLAGPGCRWRYPPTQSVVMTAVAPADIGQASGTFNMLRQLGGVFGVAICAAVFAAHGGYASAAAFTSGFGPAMGACAGWRCSAPWPAWSYRGGPGPPPPPDSGAVRAPETQPAR